MSTLSAWLRDIPLTELQRAGLKRRHLDAVRRTARANHERRLAREAVITRATAAEVGRVSARDLFIAGVVAYAAEGEKRKPWQTSAPVKFINSDPRMIQLFIRWLLLIGVDRSSLTFRVAIHRDADVDQALRFWSQIVGVPAERFQRTTLKRESQVDAPEQGPRVQRMSGDQGPKEWRPEQAPGWMVRCSGRPPRAWARPSGGFNRGRCGT